MAPFVIGLTGGIATGKSLATQYFEKLNVPVLDADVIARELVDKDSEILTAIITAFGNVALNLDGTLNRQKLRTLIFKNKTNRLQLQAILHPKIYQTLWKRAENLTNAYCLFSVPLLIESRQTYLQIKQRPIERILVIDCPTTLQQQRLIRREGLNETIIQQMLATQCDRSERLSYADDIIDNQFSMTHLQTQIQLIHQFYLQIFS